MDKVIDKYLKINHLNVSREACLDFEKFIDYVLKKNEILNFDKDRSTTTAVTVSAIN